MSKNRFSLRTGDRNVAQDFTQSQLSVSFCVGRVESRGIFILYFIRAANDPLVLTITEKAPSRHFHINDTIRHYAKWALNHSK